MEAGSGGQLTRMPPAPTPVSLEREGKKQAAIGMTVKKDH